MVNVLTPSSSNWRSIGLCNCNLSNWFRIIIWTCLRYLFMLNLALNCWVRWPVKSFCLMIYTSLGSWWFKNRLYHSLILRWFQIRYQFWHCICDHSTGEISSISCDQSGVLLHYVSWIRHQRYSLIKLNWGVEFFILFATFNLDFLRGLIINLIFWIGWKGYVRDSWLFHTCLKGRVSCTSLLNLLNNNWTFYATQLCPVLLHLSNCSESHTTSLSIPYSLALFKGKLILLFKFVAISLHQIWSIDMMPMVQIVFMDIAVQSWVARLVEVILLVKFWALLIHRSCWVDLSANLVEGKVLHNFDIGFCKDIWLKLRL